MHTIIFGKDAEYLPDGLIATPGGQLILKDGRRYTFDEIDLGYSYFCFDAPVRTNNLIEIERLAFGAGKWMLGSESLFESLADTQREAWCQLNRYRAEQSFPPIPWEEFQGTVRESHQLWFPGQSEKEARIVEKSNSEFFGRLYARRWGLARLLREQQNSTLQREVRAAAWFEGNEIPLLLRDFSEVNASARKPSAVLQEKQSEPPDINEHLLWHVEQKIRDELDTKRKAVPSHCEVFIRYCRDRMKLVDMSKRYSWKPRTLKARKAALQRFLQNNFRLTLDSFFVDRRIFAAAERQLNKEHLARRISRRALGESDIDQDDE